MSSIDEKRVYDRDTDAETVLVASDLGVLAVSIAGGRVGTVSLRSQRAAFDVLAGEDRVIVATGTDVFGLEPDRDPEALGFGPARAVALDGNGRVLAASETGVARLTDDGWREVAIEGDRGIAIRALDGELLATDQGVYRITDDRLAYSGLDNAYSVSTGGPYAGTATGLYRLANGWERTLDGRISFVSATADRAHAVSSAGLYERTDAGWQQRSLPIGAEESIRAVAYGSETYAVTGAGTLLIDEGGTWRTHPLGATDVRALSVMTRMA
jgi:hypothetical protein